MRNILVVGGAKDVSTRKILPKLTALGLNAKWYDEWNLVNKRDRLPPDCEGVLILSDLAAHKGIDAGVALAKSAGVPFCRGVRRWAKLQQQLVTSGLLTGIVLDIDDSDAAADVDIADTDIADDSQAGDTMAIAVQPRSPRQVVHEYIELVGTDTDKNVAEAISDLAKFPVSAMLVGRIRVQMNIPAYIEPAVTTKPKEMVMPQKETVVQNVPNGVSHSKPLVRDWPRGKQWTRVMLQLVQNTTDNDAVKHAIEKLNISVTVDAIKRQRKLIAAGVSLLDVTPDQRIERATPAQIMAAADELWKNGPVRPSIIAEKYRILQHNVTNVLKSHKWYSYRATINGTRCLCWFPPTATPTAFSIAPVKAAVVPSVPVEAAVVPTVPVKPVVPIKPTEPATPVKPSAPVPAMAMVEQLVKQLAALLPQLQLSEMMISITSSKVCINTVQNAAVTVVWE